MNSNIWQGKKVRLRAVETRDVELFAAWELDSDAQRNFDVVHFPRSLEQLRDRLTALAHDEGKDDNYYWMIDNLGGQTVGLICTYACNRRHGTFRYGVLISREFSGHGYASDAISIILGYYFQELNYQKVTAGIYAFNERSLKLHEHLGFRQEGRLRRMIYADGAYHDELQLGLLREEFLAAAPHEQ